MSFCREMAMWAGIFVALLFAHPTALSYSEPSKLYPGAGSSHLFAEQAFLNTTKAYRLARIAKFVIGRVVRQRLLGRWKRISFS
jgi:amino acid transporter